MKVITRYIYCVDSNIDYIVGSDAADNMTILNEAMLTDIWFHIDGHPSAHVIAKIPVENLFDKKQIFRIVKQGAVICKEASKFASQKGVKIIYTKVSDVFPTEKEGTVVVSKAKMIEV